MEKKIFYLTSAIPYVNADPHIGFTMELIQSDVLARFHRQRGDNVRLLAGTDENSLKNVQAAEKEGIAVRDFVDQKAKKFIELTRLVNLSNDDFIRTTQEKHIQSCQALWRACDANGDIYRKAYKGLYCVGCEEFKTKKELVDGLCPEHKVAPDEVEEENYFFKLSKYGDKLLGLIEAGQIQIIPESRANEVKEFIKQGLEDFSISRSIARAKNWGIPVPGDETQIMYVWFDALANYVSALGYGTKNDELFQEYWQNNKQRCHLIGKGITRFHAIYWPAMLISAGVLPPSRIYVHGYLTIDGEKISKSLGNVIDPFEVISKYGSDVVRYYLLREVPSGGDGDFSEKRLIERYNGELANGLGNLVSRVATLAEGYFEFKRDSSELKDVTLGDEIYEDYVKNFELNKALDYIWNIVALANQFVNDRKPWEEKKNSIDGFNKTITTLLIHLHHIAYLLYPFLPDTAGKIGEIFNVDISSPNLDDKQLNIIKSPSLFPRLS